MGKKRQKERFDILLFAAGLFCIGMTLWILISEISEYVQQKDWTAATAVVVDVSPHRGDYDVYYQYEAAGDIYTGKFSKVGKRALGETIEIRYNPDAPEKSNWVLEMGIKTILKDVFMIAIFWTLGARLIECSLPKKKRREDQADGRAARRVPRKKPRAAESTVDAAEVKRHNRGRLLLYLFRYYVNWFTFEKGLYIVTNDAYQALTCFKAFPTHVRSNDDVI